MDDVTVVLQTAPCTRRCLKRLDELVTCTRMKIKPSKSRSLSLRKGSRNDNTIFVAGREQIPLLVNQPIQSLGRQYNADLSDKRAGKAARKQLSEGLASIDKSQLPGKYKLWCHNFTLYQRVMWPMKMCEIPSSTVNGLDRLARTLTSESG